MSTIISIISVSQMPLPLRCEIAVLQFPGASSVILAQTLFPQRAALAVLLICLIEPVQPAGASVQGIQPQLFPCWADIGVLLSVIEKIIPLQLDGGTVMDGLGLDKEHNPLPLQHPVGQRKVIGGVRCRGLNRDNVPVNMLQLLQVRNRVIHISRRYGHRCDDAAVCICGLVGEIILSSICRSDGMPYGNPTSKYFTITTGSMGGRISGCINALFLHTQMISPAPLPISAESAPPEPNPLLSLCDISAAYPRPLVSDYTIF